VIAVNDMTLEVPRGVVFGLLGPNGAGKTTLMALVTRLFESKTGRIAVCGHDLKTEHRSALAAMVKAWNADVRKAAQQAAYQAARRTNPARYETVTATTPTTAPLLIWRL